jgi:hypothetical protein
LNDVAAIVTPSRYAQSGDDSSATASDLTAANACEGCCNGLASNCDLRVNEVLFAMVHNAMSSRNDLFAAYNNIESLEKALVAGYRGLMLDSCICDGTSIGQEAANIIKGDGDKVSERGCDGVGTEKCIQSSQ